MGSFFVYQHYSVTTILQVVTPISVLKNVILGSSLQYRSSKITPSFFVDKASCTRQFESEFSLHSLGSLFSIKEGIFLPLRLSCKESSTFSPSPSSSGSGDVTALLGAQDRYALRLADHQRSRHVVRDGTARYLSCVRQFIIVDNIVPTLPFYFTSIQSQTYYLVKSVKRLVHTFESFGFFPNNSVNISANFSNPQNLVQKKPI